MSFTPDAVLPITNTIGLGIELYEFDFIRYAFHDGEEWLESSVVPIQYDHEGDTYFVTEGGARYYLNEFLKINI